jgi:hypothetical protein
MLPCLRDTLSEPTLGGPPQRSGWCRAPVGRLGVFDRRDLVEVGSVNVHGVDPAAISSRTVKTIVDPSGDHVGSCAPDPAGSFPGPDADPCRPMLAPRLPPSRQEINAQRPTPVAPAHHAVPGTRRAGRALVLRHAGCGHRPHQTGLSELRRCASAWLVRDAETCKGPMR